MTKNDNKKLKEIIDLACEEAKRLGNTKVSPEHLFLGMLRMDQARAIDVLIALGVDFYEVKAKIEQKLNKQRDKSEEIRPESFRRRHTSQGTLLSVYSISIHAIPRKETTNTRKRGK